MKYLSQSTTKFSDLLRKIAALIVTAVLITLVLMFSAVLFAIILIAGTTAGAYLWWKTRELRKQMLNFHAQSKMMDEEMMGGVVRKGDVIEGEAIRVFEPRDENER